ncbi:hypothetical protein H9Q09_22155 [Aurantimonas sp. DM33-3]|uniref:hypothetical protein n=1 Tax=Aurantimonas sp. DM33-3 TaxID=2766955 RepID=UPI001651BFAE|nr:hypothetical protein [Aurantimonas sp. DM33-3]MBC6718875.1 hypothetical protein [Aurantimonas sp. DM33-3]
MPAPIEGHSLSFWKMVVQQGSEYFSFERGVLGQLVQLLTTEAKKVRDGAAGGAAVV